MGSDRAVYPGITLREVIMGNFTILLIKGPKTMFVIVVTRIIIVATLIYIVFTKIGSVGRRFCSPEVLR